MTLSTAFNASTSLQMTGGVWYPDGATHADIQDAIDAAVAAGGGTVSLGNRTYACTATITLDPSLVSLKGDRATLSATGSSQAVLMVSPSASASARNHACNTIEGISFRGPGNTIDAVVFDGTGSSSSARGNMRNCDIQDFRYGIAIQDNAYCNKFYTVDIRNCSNSVRSFSGGTNRGECISFFGCTMGASGIIVYCAGHSMEMFFHGCSFDFPTNSFVYTNDKTHFYGCHFEANNSSSTNGWFQVETNGFMTFFGGQIGFATGTYSGTLFKGWGTGPGKFRLYGVTGDAGSGMTITNVSSPDFWSDASGSPSVPFHQ